MTLRSITPGELSEFAGTVLQDRYKLIRHVSCGANGAVYQAADLKFDGRRVAIKLAISVFSEAQFEREARFLGQLDHQGVVKVFDHGVQDGIPFIVMEYLEGQSLDQILEQCHQRLPDDLITKFVDEIGAALRSAHGKNVIHRDLKPQNVLLVDTNDCDDGGQLLKRFVLVDFGIASKIDAKATMLNATLAGLGTPEYRSPEQLDKLDVTPSTDIYTFGVVLYELLAGRVPFPASSGSHSGFAHLCLAIANNPPPPLSKTAPDRAIDPAIEELVLQCLEKEPAKRPQSIAEVRRRYLTIADPARVSRTARPGDSWMMRHGTLTPGSSGSLRPLSSPSSAGPSQAPASLRRRSPLVLVVGLLVLLIPMAALAIWTVLPRPKPQAAPEKAVTPEKPVWQPPGFEAAGPREHYVSRGDFFLPPQLIRSVPGLPEDQKVVFLRVDMPKLQGSGLEHFYILRDKVWYALYERFVEAAEKKPEEVGLQKWRLTLAEIKHPLQERERTFASKSPKLEERQRWPVTNISPNAAACFASWLVPPSGRLPRSEEWWSAAGYRTAKDSRPGPYHGTGQKTGVGKDSPVPVGSSEDDTRDEPFGCNDLSGNGYEWTCSADALVDDFQGLARTAPLPMPIPKDQSVVYVGQNFEAKEPLKFSDAKGIPQTKSEADYTIGFRVLFEPE
ncbi:MAG TPA: bifunctional serine/threonine-protein kinase/formylglycine-generating enzyme family protein [Planctomycetaceae bacterium]|jgi:serine/threonine protein kinase|nr:bifunctional serine/threonine-protein kinase/formylglycine-generating enzyme family protein [Planctomycetaceae bacterium]